MLSIEKEINSDLYQNFGELCALEILNNGGSDLMKTIKNSLEK